MYDNESNYFDLNLENLPIKEQIFQNTEKISTKKTNNEVKEQTNSNFKNTEELFSEFYNRYEQNQKANPFANLTSKELTQPIIQKDNFLNSTKLTKRELMKSKIIVNPRSKFRIIRLQGSQRYNNVSRILYSNN